MAGKARMFAKRFIILLNVLAAVGYLLSVLAPYLNPSHWWLISFFGLGFPILLLTLLFFLIFWLLTRPRFTLISLAALIIGWKGISVFFAFHSNEEFTRLKAPGAIRVVHWNVARFLEWRRNNNEGSQKRLQMMRQIKDQNADVLCIQEFFHSTDPVYYDNLNYVMKKMGYPYYVYSQDDDGWLQYNGQIIFSRLPIVDSGIVRYPRPGMEESLIYADIRHGKDTIRFFTTHLQSVKFEKDDYQRIEKIKNREDSLLENSRSIFSKLKRASILRSRQADTVYAVTRRSPHPYIITGDLNDIPNSYTYFRIRGDLQDAFLKSGFGVGRTYNAIFPTLRIDYILAQHAFKVHQFARYPRDLSDHYMLVADLELRR